MQVNQSIIYNTVYNFENIIHIQTKNSSLILAVNAENGELLQAHYGRKISEPSSILPQGKVNSGHEFPQAYSAFGRTDNTATFRATHADGNLSTELIYNSHEISQIDENQQLVKILLKDRFYPFLTILNYQIFYKEDVIKTWVEFSHNENGEVILHDYPSVELNWANCYDEYHLTSLNGLWEREHSVQSEKLTLGKKVLDNRYGTWSSFGYNPAFMLELGQTASETKGEVVGGALAWTGAWKMTFDHNQGKLFHDNKERRVMTVIAGAESFAADYHLEAGENFSTPAFIMTYSAEGKGQVSRNLHRWSRKYLLRDGEAEERPILLNSWEGAYFTFDEEKLLSMMDGVAEMGGEMFVLDDGWFGNGENARNNAKAGLGDWQVNRDKLPNGLSFLADECKKRDLKFGIWVEPEMVNPQSKLFSNHPEWVIQQPHREAIGYRFQLMLDLSNPDVQGFVYNSVADMLNENPGISYVKWDCNRSFTNVGSTYLSKDRQTHLWVDYVKGFYSVYEKLSNEFPEVIFQACASGGGRIDYGVLNYNNEFWTSDNTDALQRVFIQWGTNHFYPAIATAAHVTICPNHQTGRSTPLKYRFDVAMSGRLGLELNPRDMNEEELCFVKSAVACYKEIRPVILQGDLYRLASPYDNHFASSMYVSESKDRAVLFAYKTSHLLGQQKPHIRLQGLDSQAKYLVTEINREDGKIHTVMGGKTISGSDLMAFGLKIDLDKEYDSAVIELRQVN